MSTHDEYSETLISIRHYSALRFAILSVFVAITGAIVAAAFGHDPLSGPRQLRIALRLFGLITAVSFWWFEFTLDGYITEFGKVALELKPNSHWAFRSPTPKTYVFWATSSLHFSTFIFWIASFCW